MQHNTTKHHSPEAVAACTWFQNLKDNTDQHCWLCDPNDVLRMYSCQLPQRKIVSDFCLFPTLRADICVPVSGGTGQCGAFGSC